MMWCVGSFLVLNDTYDGDDCNDSDHYSDDVDHSDHDDCNDIDYYRDDDSQW